MRSARNNSRATQPLAWAAILAALIFFVDGASAATLTNRDDKEHKIIIIIGEQKSEQVLKPQQSAEKICLKGCVVRLNDSDDDEYQLEADDVVSIEDGYLYHDTPDKPADPPATPPKQ